jgi:hypothetical protein
MLAGEELAIDKVLALFGRAEARDFIDLAATVDRYGLEHLCRQAAEKDRGFDLAVFRQMLNRFRQLDRAEFDLDDRAHSRLAVKVGDWSHELDRLIVRSHRLEPQLEPHTGLGLEP